MWQECVERDGPSALEITLPFDERQVLEENNAFLSKALEVRFNLMCKISLQNFPCS